MIKNKNFISEFFSELLMLDYQFSNIEELHLYVAEILKTYYSVSELDLNYLSFGIKCGKNKNDIKIIGNNFISALWMSGVIPKNTKECINNNKYEDDLNMYFYDEEKKELLINKKTKK